MRDQRVKRSFPGRVDKRGILGGRTAYAKAWGREGGH